MKKNLSSLVFSTNDSLLMRLNSYHCYFRIHSLNILFYQCAQYAIYLYYNEIDCSIPFIWCYSYDREVLLKNDISYLYRARSSNSTEKLIKVLDTPFQKEKKSRVFYLANIAFDCVDSLLSAPLIWQSYKDHLKNVQQKLTDHVYTSWWHRRFFNI